LGFAVGGSPVAGRLVYLFFLSALFLHKIWKSKLFVRYVLGKGSGIDPIEKCAPLRPVWVRPGGLLKKTFSASEVEILDY